MNTGDPVIDKYTVEIKIPRNGDIEIIMEVPNELHFDNQSAPKGVQYSVNGFVRKNPGYYSVSVYISKEADIFCKLKTV